MRPLLPFFLVLLIQACTPPQPPEPEFPPSGAANALDQWALQRAYPSPYIETSRYAQAYRRVTQTVQTRSRTIEWESIGPKNIGGRTLCLAFHPNHPNRIYLGSASGGLWVSDTKGEGADAWDKIPTGHPVLGVSSIAIHPDHPDTMFIGTGEVYNTRGAQPGTTVRTLRGTYGIGILRTTNGGQTWASVLDWSLNDMRGVWRLAYNPQNPNTLLAATTEGLYRSTDGGDSWANIFPEPMIMELDWNPIDTNDLVLSTGGYEYPNAAVYRSTDGGATFDRIDDLPDYTGKTMIDRDPSNPQRLVASVANALSGIGLFESIDGGQTWNLLNDDDIARYQGWYAHDVAISPANEAVILQVGIDAFRSNDGGQTMQAVSSWGAWFFGDVPAGEPEGPPFYVHADIHGIYFHPQNSGEVYLVTDGGLFVSEDGGITWDGRNGGYQTQQFYADFSSHPVDPDLAIGGMQDNSTAIYRGSTDWFRVIGGDGMTAAINPDNKAILYGSAQFLNIFRSFNQGNSFQNIAPASARQEVTNFSGPFVLSPSDSRTVFAGAERLHYSPDQGTTWQATSDQPVDGSNPILRIGLTSLDPDRIFVSTSPLVTGRAGVFRSTDRGQSWTRMQTLPDRICTDLLGHPDQPATTYAVFGGFGAGHLYRTTDGGNSWERLDDGLPDVPANCLVIDPARPEILYLGNDIGVYVSTNGGSSWSPYFNAAGELPMVIDLNIIASERLLRAATHGSGVWQAGLLEEITSATNPSAPRFAVSLQPNPAHNYLQIVLEQTLPAPARITVFDQEGKALRSLVFPAGANRHRLELSDLPSGTYVLRIESDSEGVVSQTFIKQ